MFPTKKKSQRDLRAKQAKRDRALTETDSGSAHTPASEPAANPLQRMLGALTQAANHGPSVTDTGLQFVPGKVLRTDQLPVDESLQALRERAQQATADEELMQLYGLHERTASISDVTPALYQAFSASAASIMNWFPALAQAVHAAESPLKLPATSIWRMPHELAQYLRLDYGETNPESRAVFNDLAAKALDLDTSIIGHDPETGEPVTKTYFIKTGEYSSKFEFANAKCSEAHEVGEYFHVVMNTAMMLGAGTTVDLCARAYIEPPAGTPTIYNGMPLRTELRAFVDLGQDLGSQLSETDPSEAQAQVLGITPYWHPSVMDRALAHQAALGIADMKRDYKVWLEHRDALLGGFTTHRDEVVEHLETLLPALRAAGLRGAWSIDVMVNGSGSETELYVIDMALMSTSALVDQLLLVEEYATATPAKINTLAGQLAWTSTDQALYSPMPGTAGATVGTWGGLDHPASDLSRSTWPEIPAGTEVEAENQPRLWSSPSVTYRYNWPAA